MEITVDTDYKEAVKWYKKAAFSGYDVAMYNLGDMYYCGLGVGAGLLQNY